MYTWVQSQSLYTDLWLEGRLLTEHAVQARSRAVDATAVYKSSCFAKR